MLYRGILSLATDQQRIHRKLLRHRSELALRFRMSSWLGCRVWANSGRSAIWLPLLDGRSRPVRPLRWRVRCQEFSAVAAEGSKWPTTDLTLGWKLQAVASRFLSCSTPTHVADQNQ